MKQRTITIDRDNFPNESIELDLPDNFMERAIKQEHDDTKVGLIHDARLEDGKLILDIELDEEWAHVDEIDLKLCLYSDIQFKVDEGGIDAIKHTLQ